MVKPSNDWTPEENIGLLLTGPSPIKIESTIEEQECTVYTMFQKFVEMDKEGTTKEQALVLFDEYVRMNDYVVLKEIKQFVDFYNGKVK